MPTTPSTIHWTHQGQPQQALWRSESGAAVPRRVEAADDTLAADTAYRMACEEGQEQHLVDLAAQFDAWVGLQDEMVRVQLGQLGRLLLQR